MLREETKQTNKQLLKIKQRTEPKLLGKGAWLRVESGSVKLGKNLCQLVHLPSRLSLSEDSMRGEFTVHRHLLRGRRSPQGGTRHVLLAAAGRPGGSLQSAVCFVAHDTPL